MEIVKRNKTINEHERGYLINIGPHQPKMRHFPVSAEIKTTGFRKTKKQNTFNPAWYDRFPQFSLEPLSLAWPLFLY